MREQLLDPGGGDTEIRLEAGDPRGVVFAVIRGIGRRRGQRRRDPGMMLGDLRHQPGAGAAEPERNPRPLRGVQHRARGPG